MKSLMREFRWPLRVLPTIATVGRYPLMDRGFALRYFSSTHAVHLHDYDGILRLGKTEIRLRPGDLTITPARIASWYDLPKPGQHWCVHFQEFVRGGSRTDGAGMAALPTHLSLGPRRAFAATRLAEIARLHVLSQSGDARTRQVASAATAAAFQEFLLWVALLGTPASPGAALTRADVAVERAAATLESRLTDPPAVPDLADLMEVTQNYLARKFRQRFGVTIPRYVLTRRIEHAGHLLAATDIPIRRIAMRVGLPDPQHFNKQFRKLVGMSPSQWRRSRAVVGTGRA